MKQIEVGDQVLVYTGSQSSMDLGIVEEVLTFQHAPTRYKVNGIWYSRERIEIPQGYRNFGKVNDVKGSQ